MAFSTSSPGILRGIKLLRIQYYPFLPGLGGLTELMTQVTSPRCLNADGVQSEVQIEVTNDGKPPVLEVTWDSGTTDLFDVQHKSATTIISDIAMTRHMKDAKATKDTLSPTAPLDPTDPVQRYLLGRMSARTRRKLMSGYGLDPNTI